MIIEISISASTKDERNELVDLIDEVAIEINGSLHRPIASDAARKKAIDVGTITTLLLQGAAAVGTSLIASMIYEKIKTVCTKPEKLTKRSSKTEIEIIDEQSGVRIVLRKQETEEDLE